MNAYVTDLWSPDTSTTTTTSTTITTTTTTMTIRPKSQTQYQESTISCNFTSGLTERQGRKRVVPIYRKRQKEIALTLPITTKDSNKSLLLLWASITLAMNDTDSAG